MTPDIAELLRAYRASRALAERPPASITLPGRPPVAKWLRAVHRAARPTWGTERWTTARVRRRVEALERALAERLALESPNAVDAQTREAVQHFKASLPAAPSRVIAVGAFVATVVLAQAIIGNLADVFADSFSEQPDLAEALGSIGPTPDVSSASTLLRALGEANFELLFAFVVGVTLSAYLVCRASSCGYRLAGLVLGRPDGLGVPRRGSDLAHATNTLDVARLEASVFTELDARPSRDFPFDLAVKALLATALVFAGLYGQRSSLVGHEDRGWWIAVGVVGVLRLLWLARASHARGDSVEWLAIPAAILVVTALTASPGPVFGPDQLPKDRAFSLELSLRQTLSGADLRQRDLRLFHLFGKDLDGADLTGADLRRANLGNTRLRGANLTDADFFDTNLQNADLRGAELEGANLDAAQLCGADLRNTDIDFIEGNPSYDSRTSWPGNGSAPIGAERVSAC